MTFTDVAALLGCITGTVSLVVSLRQLWMERFSLKIHFYEDNNLYFDRLDVCKSYKTQLQGLLCIQLENRSALPVTIHTIQIFIDGIEVSFQRFPESTLTLISDLTQDGGKRWVNYSMNQQITLPLRLDAFDAYKGFIFLPHYPFTEKLCQSVKLRLETTKGHKTKFSRIWIGKTLVDDGEGPFFQ